MYYYHKFYLGLKLLGYCVKTVLPHIHLLIGMIIANYLELNDLAIFFVIGSILPDLDWILGIVWKKNHREFATHYPMLWLVFSLIAVFFRLDIAWLFVAGFIHLLVDVVDWEVYLLRPFSNFKWSLFSLNPAIILQQDKTFKEQIVLYYQQKNIIYIELIVFGIFLFSIFLS